MIFITGANSFVGKHLTQKLRQNNIKYMGVDTNVKGSENVKNIDIRDKKIEKYLNKKTTIIHLAAVSTDKLCSAKPEKAFDINVNGTSNLINLANKKKVKNFLFASSEWVYGNFANKINYEDQEIKVENLNSLYAISKAIGEKMILSKNNKFKKIILRFGIIYGNRNTNLCAVETLFLQCLKKNYINIGSKKTSRRFIHVCDVVDGIYYLLNYNKNAIFNVAGSEQVSLEKIIKVSQKILGKSVRINETSPKSITIRRPSNKLLRKKTIWKQNIKLSSGLKMLKDYYISK